MPNDIQDVVALGKGVSPEGGFSEYGTTAIHFQFLFFFFSPGFHCSEPKMEYLRTAEHHTDL
jgi:hypothetical protein